MATAWRDGTGNYLYIGDKVEVEYPKVIIEGKIIAYKPMDKSKVIVQTNNGGIKEVVCDLCRKLNS